VATRAAGAGMSQTGRTVTPTTTAARTAIRTTRVRVLITPLCPSKGGRGQAGSRPVRLGPAAAGIAAVPEICIGSQCANVGARRDRRECIEAYPHVQRHAAAPKGSVPAMKRSRMTKLPRTLVLVGMMGAGKSTIGRRLATRLGVDFVDADAEIEAAAGCSIEDIFEIHGEAAFRDGERRVIARLLEGPVHVLATGG